MKSTSPNLNENEKSDHDLIIAETLEDIHDGNQIIRPLIKGKLIAKYVIVLSKGSRNEKER